MMTRTLIAPLCTLAAARPLGAQAPTSALSPDLARLLHDIKAADTDQLAVSEEDGRFLRVMAASTGAKQALGIGSAFGYTAIWNRPGAVISARPPPRIHYDSG